MKKNRTATISAYVAVIFVFVSGVAVCFAELVIDQSQTNYTNGAALNLGSWHAQSIEPAMSWIFAVELLCYPNLLIKGPFTVEIWQRRQTGSGYGSTADPRVGQAPLASATIEQIDTRWTNWVRWDFPDGVNVSSFVGQKILILFKTELVDGANLFLDTRNLYLKGDRYWIQNTDNPDPNAWYWHHYINWQDLTFRVWSAGGAPAVCGDPKTVYLPGDINKDCVVDVNDLLLLASHWLSKTD